MKTRSRTRDRILEVALELANVRGVHRVTTAEIAEAAGINEGNLYYYFQRKEQLVEALFGVFAAAMVATAECRLADPADPASYAAYQSGWFRLMWDYRAFYRDGASLRLLAPGLRQPLRALNLRGQAAIAGVFGTMRANALLRASDAEIDALIGNLWIVSSYWMDFRAGGQEAELTEEDLAWGHRQVQALYAPFLTDQARRAFVQS